MQDEKFKSSLEHKSALTLITECNNDQIDLTAKYQRNVVWKEEQMKAFINSIILNIIPNNIILNLSRNDNKCICLDGKQRLTSLCKYTKNCFSVEYNGELVYYDRVNDIHQKNKNYRYMTNSEKADFGRTSMSVVIYYDLTYTQQVDIFNRIQMGAKLTTGELIMSVFTTDKACETFRQFCDKNSELVSRYITSNKERNGHVVLIADMLYILESNSNNIPSKKQRDEFLSKYNTQQKIHRLLEKFRPKLNIYFSKSLFNNIAFTKSVINDMNYAVFLSLLIYCKEIYDIEKLSSGNISWLRRILIETVNECSKNKELGKRTADTVKKVQDIFTNKIDGTNPKSKQDNDVIVKKMSCKIITTKPIKC